MSAEWECLARRVDTLTDQKKIKYQDKLGTSAIEVELRGNRLSWFYHAHRRPMNATVRTINCLRLDVLLGREEQLRNSAKQFNDLKALNLTDTTRK